MARVCVLYPTRERAPGSIEKLKRELALLSGKHHVTVRIGIDDDDPTRLEAMSALRGMGMGAGIRHQASGTSGESESGLVFGALCLMPSCLRIEIVGGMSRDKVHAANRLCPHPDSYDVLIGHSDDMWLCEEKNPSPVGGPPQTSDADTLSLKGRGGGWDDMVVRALLERFPDGDGAVLCPDGNRMDLLTWPVVGAEFVRRLPWNPLRGGVWAKGTDASMQTWSLWSPVYTTICCDDELTEIARMRNRLHMGSPAIVEHKHPAWGSRERDALDEKNTETVAMMKDRGWLAARRELGGGRFDVERPVLSILTPTIPGREAALDRLRACIDAVRRRLERYCGAEIEWIVAKTPHHGDGGPTMGAKRNALLGAALGEFAMFVDDDDALDIGAMVLLVDTLCDRRDEIDALGFDCIYRKEPGGVGGWMRFRHGWGLAWENGMRGGNGIRHQAPGTSAEDVVLHGTRGICHTTPVRTEIARAVGFGADDHYREDHLFSDRLVASGRITPERTAQLPEAVYIYETPEDACRRWGQ